MRTIFHGYPSIMTALSTIIFDVDGILLNTDEVYFSELQRVLEEIHVDIDEKFFAEHGQDDCIDDVPLSKQQREQVLRTVHERYYTDVILPKVRLKPGVRSILEQVSTTFHLAIGSGETKPQILRYLSHFSIAEYFTFIGHGGLVEGRKGNPEYFSLIAKHYGVPPGECLHVGDTLTDQSALAAGMSVVIIPTKYSMHLSFDPRCHVLKKIEELPTLLARSFRPIS